MKIQSYSDIITNSSSELFVFDDGKSVKNVISTLNRIYPGWKQEYIKPDYLKNNSDDNVRYYIDYSIILKIRFKEEDYVFEKLGKKPYMHICGRNYYDKNLKEKDFDKKDCAALEFARDLGDSPEKVFDNWKEYNPFSSNWKSEYLVFSDYGVSLFKKKYGEQVLLWSCIENPDWDYQEKIMNYAKRYHLG